MSLILMSCVSQSMVWPCLFKRNQPLIKVSCLFWFPNPIITCMALIFFFIKSCTFPFVSLYFVGYKMKETITRRIIVKIPS